MAQELQPHKVTKPIQLLAAWLLGLVLVDSAFLATAKLLVAPTWAAGVLVIAAVANVPLFLVCIFLLQTRFRPEMQEDSFYSRYLEIQQETRTFRSPDQAAKLVEVLASQSHLTEGLQVMESRMSEIRGRLLALDTQTDKADVEAVIAASEKVLGDVRERLTSSSLIIEVNDLLPFYSKARSRLETAGIRISDTFGSTSSRAERPVYNVISFGLGVEGPAMHQISKVLEDLAEWYVEATKEDYSAAHIYIGSYGYGGEIVTRLDRDLLREMSGPTFSRAAFETWLSRHPIRLNADYPSEH